MPRLPTIALLSLLAATPALAQTQYELDAKGNWVAKTTTAPTSGDAAVIDKARQTLLDGHPSRAVSMLEDWIDEHELGNNPLLPEAYLLKGDSVLADGNEFLALYDYEQVCKEYPGSEQFVTALEREYDIASKYINGYKRKWLGMRIMGAEDIGEELLVRVQERLPKSRLAEKAALELANYYYKDRDLKLAADMYEIFVRNFPNSENVEFAKERRIYANIARFQGPSYDSSSLTDARVLIEDLEKDNPTAAREHGFSDALIARLDESSADHIMEKANWYLHRGDLVSARFVLRRLVAEQPRTISARAAIKILESHHWEVAEPKAAIDDKAAALAPPPGAAVPDTSPAAPAEPPPPAGAAPEPATPPVAPPQLPPTPPSTPDAPR